MSVADHLLHLEEQFWKAGSGFYRDNLAPDALMVFAEPAGLMTKQAIVESISAAPRWRRIDFEDSTHVQLKPGVMLLTYRATAERDGEEPYAARASSVYIECEDGWQLAFHQQTPIQ